MAGLQIAYGIYAMILIIGHFNVLVFLWLVDNLTHLERSAFSYSIGKYPKQYWLIQPQRTFITDAAFENNSDYTMKYQVYR